MEPPTCDDLDFVSCFVDISASDTASTAYLIIRLGPHGQIKLEGNRQEVEEFLAECARVGLVLNLDHLSWCG